MLPAIVSAASLAVISGASIALYNKANAVQADFDTKMRSVVDQINTTQYYDYEIEKKNREGIDGLSKETEDIRRSYISKGELNDNISTKNIQAQNMSASGGNISVTGNKWNAGSLHFNSTLEGSSKNPDYMIQRGGNDALKNRLVINAPNETGAGIDFTSSGGIPRMSVDTVGGQVNIPNAKADKLQVGDKWQLSGVGDKHANDSWLRFFDKDGKDYHGGIATANTWTRDNSYMNQAQGNHFTSKGNGDWNWYEVQRGDGNMYFGGDANNRGIWSEGNRPVSVYTQGKPRITVNNDGQVDIPNIKNTNISAEKINLGNKWQLSGVGDKHANDGWLRFFDKNGNDYYGGIATANTWTRDNSFMNQAHTNVVNTNNAYVHGAAWAANGYNVWNNDPGPLVEKRYSWDHQGNRYGVGQFPEGNTRVYTASTYPGKVSLSRANEDGSFDDVVTVNPDRSTKISGPIKLGDKWSISPVGDKHANDSWLRFFDKDGKDYHGGIATANTWTRDNSYMNQAQGNHFTSKGNGDWNWYEVQRGDGNMYFGGDANNRGIWSDGDRSVDIYTKGSSKLSVKPDGTVNIPGTLKVGTVVTEVWGAPGKNFISTDNKDGTNWFTIQRNDGNIKMGTDGTSRGIVNDGDKNFSIYNSGKARLSVTKEGNVGVGTETPSATLDVPGTAKIGDLTATKFNITDFNLNNNAVINGTKFSRNWTGYPDNANDRSEIANDPNNGLMVVGNRTSRGGPRTVGVWDQLNVNGTLNTTGAINAAGALTSGPITSASAKIGDLTATKFNITDFNLNNNAVINGTKFSRNWTGYPDNANDRSEIANDPNNGLMVVGNRTSKGGPRTVGVWDQLNVNGTLNVSNKANVSGGLSDQMMIAGGGDFGSARLRFSAHGPGAGWVGKIQSDNTHRDFKGPTTLRLNPEGGNIIMGAEDYPHGKLDVRGSMLVGDRGDWGLYSKANLHVRSTANPSMTMERIGKNTSHVYTDNANNVVFGNENAGFSFKTKHPHNAFSGGEERVLITPDGKTNVKGQLCVNDKCMSGFGSYEAFTRAHEPAGRSEGWNLYGDPEWDPVMHPGGIGRAYNNEQSEEDATTRWIDYNIPAGMKQGYLVHLPWFNCRFFRIYGVKSDGKEVFIRYVNAFQSEKNGSVGGNHDGLMAISIPGANRFAKIRIRGSRGRMHLMGIGWTTEDARGSETGVSVLTPVEAWQTSTDGKFREYHAVNGRTFYGSPNGYEWRNATDGKIASLDNNGSLTANGVLLNSDIRLKENVGYITDEEKAKLDYVMPVTYSLKDDPDKKKQFGFVAQDMERVYPELVNTDKNSGIKSVAYTSMVPILAARMKDVNKQVQHDKLCIGDVCVNQQELKRLKYLLNQA